MRPGSVVLRRLTRAWWLTVCPLGEALVVVQLRLGDYYCDALVAAGEGCVVLCPARVFFFRWALLDDIVRSGLRPRLSRGFADGEFAVTMSCRVTRDFSRCGCGGLSFARVMLSSAAGGSAVWRCGVMTGACSRPAFWMCGSLAGATVC